MPYTHLLEKPEEWPNVLFRGTDIVQAIVCKYKFKGALSLAPRGIESVMGVSGTGTGGQAINEWRDDGRVPSR